MPLYDTSSRLRGDRCYRALRDSDNQKMSDMTMGDLRRARAGAIAGKGPACPAVCDRRIRDYITGTRRDTQDDEEVRDGSDPDSDSDSSCDSEAFLLLSSSHFSKSNAKSKSAPNSNGCGGGDGDSSDDDGKTDGVAADAFMDSAACCDGVDPGSVAVQSRNLRVWNGYGVGACVPAAREERSAREAFGYVQPRTFVAAPHIGSNRPSRVLECAPPSEGPSVRRGGGRPLTGTIDTYCDTFLVERNVHTGHRIARKKSAESCGEGTGRVVDRLAERRWDTFDPVIRTAPSAEVNALPPCDWVHGGAASRDIARHPVFLKMRGYKHDGRTWRRD